MSAAPIQTRLPALSTRLVVGLLLGLLSCVGSNAFAANRTEQIEFFENKIRPVLVRECYECHSAKKAKGGLRVDFRDGLLQGGDTGPAVVPGNVAKSLLISSIRHATSDLKMPAKAPKLGDGVIRDFEKWVQDGAADPRNEPGKEVSSDKVTWEETFQERRQWWSFQPVAKVSVPTVKDSTWSQQPVDRFLQAKLEEKGLTPAAPADKRTLIRRVTLALTGLPPSPADITRFVEDTKPDAYERLVDRLLASPQFGERWARHWMDLVRYAETHGSEGDPEIREAWRYRDYLVRAFNADVPVDQLIREHIAGDLLSDPRVNRAAGINESILGIAQLRMNEHGYQPVDTLEEQVRVVDNQIDVLTKAFQGLTVSCARCHDHKFDPISQRDYYALYGVLANCRPAQVEVDLPEELTKQDRTLADLKAQIQSKLAEAWLRAADEIPKRLQATEDGSDALAQQVRTLEDRVKALETEALAKVLSTRTGVAGDVPAPMARWSFDGDARDSIGQLHGTLQGGATIRNGRLILNGTDAHVRIAPLGRSLTEKAFEAWVAPANLNQRGGGVMTVQSTGGKVFDSLVFAEKEPQRWVPGSDFFSRSKNVGGPEETATPGELVHLVVAYGADGSVAMYRNGVPYGHAYTNAGQHTFGAQDSEVLLGRRHTGGGSAFFAGEIEDARLYDHALTPAEVASSFRAGPVGVSREDMLKAMSAEAQAQYAGLQADLEKSRAELKARDEKSGRKAWQTEIASAVGNLESPLHAWTQLRDRTDADFAGAWNRLANESKEASERYRRDLAEKYTTQWDLARDGAQWFKVGEGIAASASEPGAFAIDPAGERVLSGLYPVGFYTHELSQKHGGLLTSPRFKIETDSISVLAAGGRGSMVRVILDNYPLNNGQIFQLARLESDEPKWVRLDTNYRKGTWAYLEFGTYEDLTKPILAKEQDKPADGRSYFGALKVVTHNSKDAPKKENVTSGAIFAGDAPHNPRELAAKYVQLLVGAINAWREGRLTEPQRAVLDNFIRHNLLPVTLSELPTVAPLVAEYRRVEGEVLVARRAPGVIEGTILNAPLFPRGDHLKPGELVPRGYLQVVDARAFRTEMSGRLELAQDLSAPDNPLTARVMVNRLWHHLFGRGLVPTVDNFGRLGDRPTHPELLDYLAGWFVQHRWSTKELVRLLVTSRAYQMASEPTARSAELDPANDWLSHFRVQRLDAEAIRDSLLAVAGELDLKREGPSVGINDQHRRSIYLAVRRTNLSPFLEVFDAPKPFTTLGRRDATNVPAQSLALLNDPFVIALSGKWAASALKENTDADVPARVRRMFDTALGRAPSESELKEAVAYLNGLSPDGSANLLQQQAVWQDFAQSLFNVKEFIYIR